MEARLLSLLLAALLPLAGGAGEADPVRILRGPWWWHGPDGGIHLAIAVAGTAFLPTGQVVVTIDGREMAATAAVADTPPARDGTIRIASLALPAPTRGEVRWTVAGTLLRATVAPAPARHAAVRIILAGAGCWPDRSALDGMSRHLGGAPDLVLALGAGCAIHLGTGGWEGSTPVAVIAPVDPSLAASTGGADASWRHGLRSGVLGLPASPDRGRADLALARDLSPWLVYCDVPAGWDPAISRPVGVAADAGVLLAACKRLAVPLILGAGRSGLLSEPVEMLPGGAVVIGPGGPRLALAVPTAEDGLSGLPSEIALPLEQPLICGLTADASRLALVLARPGATDAVSLAYVRGDETSPGYGRGDGKALATRLAAVEDLTAARTLIEALLWLPRPELAKAVFTSDLLGRLRDEGGASGRALVRRMAVIYSGNPTAPAIPGDPDPLAARDTLLWQLSRVHGSDALSWREAAATSPDPLVLRALLADLARDPQRDALPALIRRLELQAAGAMPVDPDPLDQHRLCSAVFDEVRLSPTVLRKLAVQLRDKVDPLARGPLDRFIARHGETRPVP